MISKTIFLKIILILSFFIIGYIKAQGPAFNYVKQIGVNGNDVGHSIVTDNVGNVYVAGWFSGITDFDPGIATYTLSSFGGEDAFVTKFDPIGNFLWVKQIGGNGDDRAFSLALDNNNDIYVTGNFIGTCDFDPSATFYNLTTFGGTQIGAFFLKLNSSGNFIWAKDVGSSLPNYSNSVDIDASNNCYFTGRFSSIVDFDPSPSSTYTLNAVYVESFVLKLNTNGDFVWATSISGSSGSIGNAITVDVQDNILVTGYYSGSADFDSGPSTFTINASGQKDVFVLKLDNLGNFIWVKSLSGTADEEAFSINSDNDGNIYTTGYFKIQLILTQV